MLPRVALEYGQISWAPWASASAISRGTPGTWTLSRLDINREIRRQRYLLLLGHDSDGGRVAGRPGSGEQLLSGRVRLDALELLLLAGA